MKRIEIIANRSVQEELFDLMARAGVGASYTLIPQVQGAGQSEPKHGDSVWPEYNFLLIVYCEEHESRGLIEAVRELKRIFPDEGIRLFEAEAHAVV